MNYKFVDNVLLEKELFKLYKALIENSCWNLARSSSFGEIGTFPGFIIREDYDKSYNDYWNGYFTSLYERIKIKFYEKYKYNLPDNIFRIHLGAKNETSFTEFHKDSEEGGITILGFLTPMWSKNWEGALQLEENEIEYKPGKFLIFDSNKIHNGFGPNKKIPYWRISINYIVK